MSMAHTGLGSIHAYAPRAGEWRLGGELELAEGRDIDGEALALWSSSTQSRLQPPCTKRQAKFVQQGEHGLTYTGQAEVFEVAPRDVSRQASPFPDKMVRVPSLDT